MISAHSFGARYDLPIPLLLFVLGGAAVVVASFLLVMARSAVALPAEVEDRAYVGDRVGGRVGDIWAAGAVVVFLLLVVAGFAGSQETAENILPTTFWVLWWLAVPLLCGVLGDWTRSINPFRALGALGDAPRLRRSLLGRAAPLDWPAWLGWWPAVVVFFTTACCELIFNSAMVIPANMALALLVYGFLCAVGGLLFGSQWLARGEMFSVLFDAWGRLGFFRFGAPGRRGFGGGLVPFAPTVSRVAFILLLLISVNFDGILATPRWADLERRMNIAEGHAGDQHAVRVLVFLTLAALIAAVFGFFATRAAAAGRHRDRGPLAALAGLLPSLLPIAFAYLLVHNLQYVLVNAQLMIPLIGNPVGDENWPLTLPDPFNDSYEVSIGFLPNAFYWYVGVVLIVAAHVAAVVLAHAHLTERGADEPAARRSEYPWLIAMVGYTMLSLWLIAQPLVDEGGHSEATGRDAVSVQAEPRTGSL